MANPNWIASLTHEIVSTVRESLLVLDANLRVRLANRSFYQLFQVTPDETEGKLVYELGNGQWDIPALRHLLEQVLPQQEAFDNFEVIHDFPSIGRKVMLLNARRVLRNHTESDSILLAIEDITERHRLQEERQELETRFTSLVKNIRDHSIFTLDVDGRITSWNSEAERILGYSEEEVLGRHFSLIFTPEDRAAKLPDEELNSALSTGRAEDERWHLRKNGERFWALGIVSPMHNLSGNHSGYSKILRDMTDRKRTEEELLENRERLRMAMSAGEMGTWLWRIPADEQVIDNSLRRLMGLPEGDDVYTLEQFLAAVHEDDRDRVRRQFEDGVRTGSDINIEFRVVWPDGSIHWLKDRGKVFPGPDGRPSISTGACVDITARKQMEEELQQADRRKDEYLAVLAHELRNPLAPIRTSVDILKTTAAQDRESRHVLDLMDQQLDHIVRLVDDLLDVSRIRQGKIELRKERIEIAAVVNSAVEASRPWFEGRHLTVTVSAQRIHCDADPTRLTQIIGNLLHNAAKFTAENGHIALSVEQEGNDVIIRVRDDGVGLEPDQLHRIFDMFAQVGNPLNRKRVGLGLGLTLVRNLVQLHGGSVEAHSKGLGTGSEFIVRLPCVSDVPELPAVTEPGSGIPKGAVTGKRILVVDDNKQAADMLALFLRLSGNEAEARYDGLEGVRAAEAFRPEIIILDLDMPKLNGYDACRQIRAEPWGKEMILVALTGWGQQNDLQATASVGFDAHVVKPVKPAKLQDLLQSLLLNR